MNAVASVAGRELCDENTPTGMARKTRLYRWWRDVNTIRVVIALLGIAVLSTLLTLIVPGLVADRGDVFYKQGVYARLKGEASKRRIAFDAAQEHHRKTIERLDKLIIQRLSETAADPNVESLFRLRDQVSKTMSTATPPIAVIPFYLNPQMLLWPATYTCLLWIAVLMAPHDAVRFKRILFDHKTHVLAIITYLFYEWPLWLRNFVLTDEGRVVYGYPNFDIHVGSFVMQELVIFGFCLILAVIWRQWAIYREIVRDDDPEGHEGEKHLELLTDPEAARSFADVFTRWTVCSFLLALAFIGLTAFYWNLVGKYHDQRYLLSAILAHVLWGITWLTLSRPLINEWWVWHRCRTYAFQVLLKTDKTEEAVRKAALLKDIQPVTSVTLTVANTTSVVSFVIPIVQAFIG